MEQTFTFTISGMSCAHCKSAAEKALASVPGVTSVSVCLETEQAQVTGETTIEDLANALDEIGFELKR